MTTGLWFYHILTLIGSLYYKRIFEYLWNAVSTYFFNHTHLHVSLGQFEFYLSYNEVYLGQNELHVGRILSYIGKIQSNLSRTD